MFDLTSNDTTTDDDNRSLWLGFSIALLLLTAGLTALAAAQPTTITVCQDTTSCEKTSIQAGIDAADAGDTVEVRDGTYNEHITIDKAITVRNDPDESSLPTLATISSGTPLVRITADDATFHSFDLDNTHLTSTAPVVEVPADGVTLQDLDVTTDVSGAAPYEIVLGPQTSDALVQDVSIERTELSGHPSIRAVDLQSAQLVGNELHDGPIGLDLASAATVELRSNTIHNAFDEGIFFTGGSQTASLVLEDNDVREFDLGSNDVVAPLKVVDEAGQINGETDPDGFRQAVLDANPGLSEVHLEWMTVAPGETIDTKIATLDTGDTLLVYPGVYRQSFTVDQQMTVRAPEDVDEASVVNGTGADLTVAKVTAPGATVRGLTIQWSGQSDEQVRGIDVAADGVSVEDNTVQVGNTATAFAFAVDISGNSDVAVISNTIEATPGPTDQQLLDTNSGIAAFNADAPEIRSNTIEGWFSHGIFLTDTEDARLTDNTFQANQRGFTLCNTVDPVLDGNRFEANLQAGWFCGSLDDGDDADGFSATLRENRFGVNGDPQPLVLDGVEDATLDARLNDWSVYDPSAIETRVNDGGTDNEILQTPFLLADGSPEPGLVRIQGEAREHLTIQDALTAAEPGDTVLVPASADAATPTAWTEGIDVATADATVCGTVGGGPACTSEIAPGHQQLSRAAWADAPGLGSGEAVLFDNVANDVRSTSYFPPEDAPVEQIDRFAFDLYLADGSCADVDLQATLAIDETPDDGTHDRDRLLTITPDLSDECRTGEWFHVDLFDADTQWNFAGDQTRQEAIESVDDTYPDGDYEVSAVNVAQIDDLTVTYLDNRIVSDVLLGERADVACSGFGTSTEDDPCRQGTARERTVIDALGQSSQTATLSAQGTTLADLTVQNTDRPADDTGTVLLTADDTTLTGTRVIGNLLEGDGTFWGQEIGVQVGSADDYTIADNTIERWSNMGIFVAGGSAGDGVIADNTIRENTNHAIYLGGSAPDSTIEVLDNDIGTHDDSALRLANFDRDHLIRGNDLSGAKNQAVRVSDHHDDRTLDLRGNHWGVVRESAIRERITDSGDHRIQVVPYLDASGDQHPPKPIVQCFTQDDGGLSTLTTIARTLSFQEAADLELPETCVDRDGNGGVHRTIVLGTDEEAYNGASIDTETTVMSDTGALRAQTDGIVAGGARIEANNHQPAIELTAGVLDTTILGVTVQGEPVGADGIVIDGLDDGETVTIADARVGTREHPTSTGLRVVDTDDVRVRSSVFVSGQPAIDLVNTADVRVHDNSIALSPTSPDDPTRPAGAVHASDALAPRIEDNVIHGAQTPNSQAIALERASEPIVRNNLVEGAVVGLYLDESTDGSVTDNVVLLPPANALTSDTHGISLHGGSDHTLERNLVSGARNGLVVNGATGVLANQTQLVGVQTGVEIAQLTDEDGPAPHLELHNARLATTATALGLGSGTEGLTIDAQCNDWGVYHADLIPARIDDEGTDNTVDYTPYTSADQDDADVSCLTPPDADFTRSPDGEVTRLDEIDFSDDSEAGSRPIAEWRWDLGDGTTVQGSTSDERAISHTYQGVGTFNVVLEVEDTDGMVSRAIQEVTVENIAPALDPIDNQQIHHTETIDVDVRATDAEGDELTLTASPAEAASLPDGLSLDDHGDGTGTLSWEPAADQYGIHKVQVTADDGQPSNATDSQVVQLDVDNPAPVFDPALPANLPAAVDRTLSFDVHAEETDADELDALTAEISELPDNATFTKTSTNDGTLEWTPAPGEEGAYNVTFVASGPGHTVSETVPVTVGEENLPPLLELTGDSLVPEKTTARVVAYANDTDSLDINWTTVSTPSLDATTTIEDTTEGEKLVWTAAIPEGTETVDVSVTAEDGISPVSGTSTLTIQALPDGIALQPSEDNTGITTTRPIVDEPVTLRLNGADRDGTVTSVTVQPEGPDGPTLDMTETEPSIWTADWRYETEGHRTLTYTLTDDDGLTDTVQQTVSPLVNTAPTVDVTPGEIRGQAETINGLPVFLSGFAEDPELRPLGASAFSWQLPNGQTVTGRSVQPTIPVGVHTVALEVTDPYGLTGTATATIKVDDTISLDAALTGADGETETGIARIDPAGHAFEQIAGTVQLTDDRSLGVASEDVSLEVTYHGTEANSLARPTTYQANVTTDANGDASWSFDQEALGAADRGESILSAPGYHEITFDTTTPSRAGAWQDDVESASTTIAYWVGPEGTGPSMTPSDG